MYLAVEITSTPKKLLGKRKQEKKNIIQKCNLIKLEKKSWWSLQQPVSQRTQAVYMCHQATISNAKPKWIFAFA